MGKLIAFNFNESPDLFDATYGYVNYIYETNNNNRIPEWVALTEANNCVTGFPEGFVLQENTTYIELITVFNGNELRIAFVKENTEIPPIPDPAPEPEVPPIPARDAWICTNIALSGWPLFTVDDCQWAMKALLGRAIENGGGIEGIDYMFPEHRAQIPNWVALAEGAIFSAISGLNEDFTPTSVGLTNGIEMRINKSYSFVAVSYTHLTLPTKRIV